VVGTNGRKVGRRPMKNKDDERKAGGRKEGNDTV